MECFEDRLKNTLLEYKNTDVDDLTGWDPVLHKKMKDFFNENEKEFFTILKKFICDFDYNSGIMDFLSACVLGDEDYRCDTHLKMILDIFDNHPDENKRHMMLVAINDHVTDFIPELEERYECETNPTIKNDIGNAIVRKLVRQAGWRDWLNLSSYAYNGNIDRFYKLLNLTTENQPIERLDFIKFLQDLKYIPNNMRVYLKELTEQLQGGQQ